PIFRRQVVLGAISVAHEHPFACVWVIRLDHALHECSPPGPSGCLRSVRGRYRRPILTGEFAVISRLRERFPAIGDDAAVVDPPEGPLLLAADAVVAGVHTPADTDLTDVGWRAVVVNVSDIAAMGGRPLHALVTVAAPPGTDLDRLFDGVAEAAQAYVCPVVGGDLTAADTLVVTVAVTGTVDGTPVRRSGDT